MNKTLFILSIILGILSLIYLSLKCYGINRYIYLHLNSPEAYIEEYSSLDKASEKRIVVSMTTTEDCSDKLIPCINSLLDQTVKVDEICLNIPDKCKIPENISNYISVYRNKDYKSGNKLIPTILREKSKDVLILVVESDKVYGETFIEDIINEYNKDNDSLVVYTNSEDNAIEGELLVNIDIFSQTFIDMFNNSYDDIEGVLYNYINKTPKRKYQIKETFRTIRHPGFELRNRRIRREQERDKRRLLVIDRQPEF